MEADDRFPVGEEEEAAAPPSDDEEEVPTEKVLTERELTEFEKKEKKKGVVSGHALDLCRASGHPLARRVPADPSSEAAAIHEAGDAAPDPVRVRHGGQNLLQT